MPAAQEVKALGLGSAQSRGWTEQHWQEQGEEQKTVTKE